LQFRPRILIPIVFVVLLLTLAFLLSAELNPQKDSLPENQPLQLHSPTNHTTQQTSLSYLHSSLITTYNLITKTATKLVVQEFYMELNPGCMEFFIGNSSTSIIPDQVSYSVSGVEQTTITVFVSTVVSTVTLNEGTQLGDGGCHTLLGG
jgi:hypothetical protein